MNEENEVREENSSDTQKDSSPPEHSEAADKEVSERDTENASSEKPEISEKSDTSDSSDTASAVDEIIDAIKKELDSRTENEADSSNTETSDTTNTDSEAAELGSNDSNTEENSSESMHTGRTRIRTYDSDDPFDEEEDEEISVYTVASASDLPPYQATVVSRLDNILTCAIITACCAVLVLFHTLKRE